MGVIDVILYGKGQNAQALANEAGNVMFDFECKEEQKRENSRKTEGYWHKKSERYSKKVEASYRNRARGKLSRDREVYPLLFINNKIIPHDLGEFMDK